MAETTPSSPRSTIELHKSINGKDGHIGQIYTDGQTPPNFAVVDIHEAPIEVGWSPTGIGPLRIEEGWSLTGTGPLREDEMDDYLRAWSKQGYGVRLFPEPEDCHPYFVQALSIIISEGYTGGPYTAAFHLARLIFAQQIES